MARPVKKKGSHDPTETFLSYGTSMNQLSFPTGSHVTAFLDRQ